MNWNPLTPPARTKPLRRGEGPARSHSPRRSLRLSLGRTGYVFSGVRGCRGSHLGWYLFRMVVELVALRRVAPRTAAQCYPRGLHPVSSAAERGGVVAARQPLPRMGEGESCSVGRRIRPRWKLRETVLAVPSPVGYGFAALRARGRSADFQSAVSPNCIRQGVGLVPRVGLSQRLAECNSAIRQSITLRYEVALNRYPVGRESVRVRGNGANAPREAGGFPQ